MSKMLKKALNKSLRSEEGKSRRKAERPKLPNLRIPTETVTLTGDPGFPSPDKWDALIDVLMIETFGQDNGEGDQKESTPPRNSADGAPSRRPTLGLSKWPAFVSSKRPASSSSRREMSQQIAQQTAAGSSAAPSGDQNFDYMFKLLIIGNSSVGKTSFLFRYCDDSFTSAFVSTVGIDFKVKTVFRGDKRVKLQIWDTAGQERYRTITTAYYRGAMGFILMYDITNEESFNSVQDWCTQIKTYSWENAQVVLVGNKCDMDDERVVSYERGRQLADQLGLEFFETSAKENINVKAVFEKLVEIICNKMAESLDKDQAQSQPKGHKLDQPTNQKPAGQQCNC
uniref:Ras-related protein Rab-3 n=1 Tax=Rhabditophanes sp. KR3021 TaxID=114890 RepID=A0AC35U807_9BILA